MMNIRRKILGLSLLTISLFSTSSVFAQFDLIRPITVARPDLKITVGQVNRVTSAEARGSDYYRVQVELGLYNAGNAPAGRFMLGADYQTDESDRFFYAPMKEPFNDNFGVWIDGLEPKESFFFLGFVYLPKIYVDDLATLKLRIDSCAGEEFTPDYCRVLESNENNNDFYLYDVELN